MFRELQVRRSALDKLRIWEPQVELQVAQLEERLVGIRRHLHSHPEPSGEEIETSQFLLRQLGEAGLVASLGRRGLGVVADVTLGGADERTPLIAIRADIDGLLLRDEKRVSYASQNGGVAHACGHDVHATIALGAALAALQLDKAPDPPPARLRFIFQPAEESSLGAKWMIEQGALEGVSCVFSMHVDPERPVGTVGVRYGVLTANCDEVEIVVTGRGGHAARPHHTVDPIAAAVQLVGTLYQQLPRAVDAREPSVLTIGQITGGHAPNVIPLHVDLRGSLRTTDPHVRHTLKRRIDEICRGVEQATGAQIDLQFLGSLHAVDNDHELTSLLAAAARQVVGNDNVVTIDRPSMGGEDFSAYLEHVPGSMLRLGCAGDDGDAPFLHSPVFDVDERALSIGARIVLRAALLATWQQLEQRQESNTRGIGDGEGI